MWLSSTKSVRACEIGDIHTNVKRLQLQYDSAFAESVCVACADHTHCWIPQNIAAQRSLIINAVLLLLVLPSPVTHAAHAHERNTAAQTVTSPIQTGKPRHTPSDSWTGDAGTGYPTHTAGGPDELTSPGRLKIRRHTSAPIRSCSTRAVRRVFELFLFLKYASVSGLPVTEIIAADLWT
ncbi:hypothetical protein EXN66_Car003413 [Channa argus]|uniref:Uncharacterized protein n=1 Tax=Channa argus TaxID=215402 RepID=A0A6G1PBR5_CHAAH|nr:hypothetical protein EXN66_Car003413 [Channa argus]